MEDEFDFSAALRELCENDQVKQVTIALAARVSPATVSRWLNSGYAPSVSELCRLRDALHFPQRFREACANATRAGQRAAAAELVDLDADGDGKLTMADVRTHANRRQLVAAERAMRIEQAWVRGIVSAEEFATQIRLWNDEQLHAERERRTWEIVAGRPSGGARRLL